MKLVIVESPTKGRTISKFLGKGYTVESSYGHVRDLPKSQLGVDVLNNFAPKYLIPKKAKEVVKKLLEEARKAKKIILATDEDREGEAIAWHLVQALGLNAKQIPNPKSQILNVERIVFHEITKTAIKEALEHPRAIDMNLVDAQQARRILDRLVGYELSPFLWRKIRYGLSAGRVQSVTLRLVVEREREIQNFRKEEHWSVEADFCKRQETGDRRQETKPFRAKLTSIDGKPLGKMDVRNGGEAEKITNEARKQKYAVSSVAKKEINRNPSPPFTTSTLQQEAARKLGFSAKQTMVVAQRLYEEGFITYMRTDSVNLAESALAQAKTVVSAHFGEKYALPEPRRYATKTKGAQEAHEAIRPTDFSRLPPARFELRSESGGSPAAQTASGQAKKSGEKDGLKDRGQQKLYDLIWKRAIASQMQTAQVEQTSVDIASNDKKYSFRATGQIIKFDGFIKVYTEGRDDKQTNGEEEYGETLPEMKEGDSLVLKRLEPIQHFTEPPPRYSDATLVKTLETYGIGRPSTYAPILSTIQDRGYVEKIEKKYHPTEIGFIVNDLLVEHFPEIVDVNFTSHIEEEFDEVAEGKIKWAEVAREFYLPFKKHLDEKEAEVKKHIEVSETPCPHCGKKMVIKFGRMGKFLACPDPEVKITLPMPEEAEKIRELEEKTRGEKCPLCGKEMKVKRSRFGYFLGCVDYPKCKGVAKIFNKTGFKCPKCGSGDVVEKKSRGRGRVFYACSRWPECDFIINKKPESDAELEEMFKNFKEKVVEKSTEIEKGTKKKADQ